MRLPKLLTIAIALLALAALVAGCGGGGDDETTETTATETTTALTKAELIAQGNAICGEVNAAVGATGASEAEVPEQIVEVANLYIGMVDRIKDLGTPAEADGYSEFIAAGEELAKVEGEVKLASEREDTLALGEAATRAAPILEEFASVAGDYGFEECSEGPSAPAPTGSGSGVGAEETPEEGGVEVVPEEPEIEVAPEEAAPEEVAPETGGAGGAGGGVEEPAPETGTGGGSSGGVGPG
ncbi:MAG TPA: hypothetical protein VFX85_13840 [Solirubrobacterales bacterium]|nr:hypothetical protein [Solirubrobacterales bacterium]